MAANCGMPAAEITALLRKMRPKSSSSGKDLVLQRQEDAGGIDEVDERQAIFQGDPLGAQHLLAGHREERAGFDRGVVGDHHHLPPATVPMPVTTPADGAPPQSAYIPGGPQAELEEVGSGIDKPGDAFAGGQAALGMLAIDGFAAAAETDLGLLLSE